MANVTQTTTAVPFHRRGFLGAAIGAVAGLLGLGTSSLWGFPTRSMKDKTQWYFGPGDGYVNYTPIWFINKPNSEGHSLIELIRLEQLRSGDTFVYGPIGKGWQDRIFIAECNPYHSEKFGVMTVHARSTDQKNVVRTLRYA